MEKVLIIVDPQNDFIIGSMEVEDAERKMELLKNHIKNEEYDKIIITLDWHPVDHCSFKGNGGLWPDHCIAFTEGALPDRYLMEEIYEKYPGEKVLFITKGKNKDIEEYGALDLEENGDKIFEAIKDADEIRVAGIMAEYCVLSTVEGLVNRGLGQKLNLLLPFISTADNYKALLQYAEDNNVKYIDLKL